MRIGIAKEIKDRENRVALTPEGAGQLVASGHRVVVERDAGLGSGFGNEQYQACGAHIGSTKEAWDSDLVVKIKEPLEQEYAFLKDNVLFTYLHLAGVPPDLTDALLKAGTTAIAYETVEDDQGNLPLLAPMSAVAGNMSVSMGNYYLARFNGGKGVQLGGLFGERHGNVMVIGAGTVGQHAALTAAGMGANVLMFGRVREKYERNPELAARGVEFIDSTPEAIASHITEMDLVVGGVLLPGARAPHVVSETMVRSMATGSAIVDVSIDQGGCVETARPTTHSDPVFVVHDVIHYCVTNMPGAYPRTSTIALTHRTLPYIRKLADTNMNALCANSGFGKGVNTHQGNISYRGVAEALERMSDFKPFP